MNLINKYKTDLINKMEQINKMEAARGLDLGELINLLLVVLKVTVNILD